MNTWLQIVTIVISSGTLVGVVKLAFNYGGVVSRLESVEHKVADIDLYGCRHRQSAECSGDD